MTQATLENVTLTLKANIYFDGGVVSHTITAPGAPRRSVGIIRKGAYDFGTDAAERMDIIAGSCRVKLAGAKDWQTITAGAGFDVPAKSRFDIVVDEGSAEYLCTYG